MFFLFLIFSLCAATIEKNQLQKQTEKFLFIKILACFLIFFLIRHFWLKYKEKQEQKQIEEREQKECNEIIANQIVKNENAFKELLKLCKEAKKETQVVLIIQKALGKLPCFKAFRDYLNITSIPNSYSKRSEGLEILNSESVYLFDATYGIYNTQFGYYISLYFAVATICSYDENTAEKAIFILKNLFPFKLEDSNINVFNKELEAKKKHPDVKNFKFYVCVSSTKVYCEYEIVADGDSRKLSDSPQVEGYEPVFYIHSSKFIGHQYCKSLHFLIKKGEKLNET